MRIALAVHILAGALGILAGFVALAAAKGAHLHRKSGRIFVYTMIAMALLGALMAVVRSKAPQGNVPVASPTVYLVITARPSRTGCGACA